MRRLEKALNTLFKARSKKPDTQRKQREEAKRLAAGIGVELEKLRDGGINVWPPGDVDNDPYEGDHFADDWATALVMVKTYAEHLRK